MTSPLRTRELKSALSLAIVPDTCDPTWTVTTAFTVPVRSTASRISPRSTVAPKYWRLSPWRKPKPPIVATTTPTGAITSHFRFEIVTMGRRRNRSFVAQCLDRVEVRRLARRVVAEEYADGDRERGGDDHRCERGLHRPAEAAADEERRDEAQHNPGRSTDEAQDHGLPEELKLDRLFRGAHGDADADLAGPLRHRHKHDVHDADAADDEGDRRDGDEENRQRATRLELGVDDVLGVPNVEVVVLVGAQMVPVAEERGRLTSGELDGVLRHRRAENVVEPRAPLDLLHRGRVREDDRVVLILPRHGQPLRPEHRDHLAGKVLDADYLANGVIGAEELLPDRAANHADISGAIDVVLRERGALVDHPSFDVEVFHRHAAVLGEPVLIAVDDLRRSVDVRRHALDQRNLILDGGHIGKRQRRRRMRPSANSVDGAAAFLDPDEIVAEVVQLLFDARLAGIADGDHADDGRDADRDAEHRQETSHLVAEQGPKSRADHAALIHTQNLLNFTAPVLQF